MITNRKAIIFGLKGYYLYDNEKVPKWKHLGDKSQWIYPFQINFNIIKEQKKVILIESVGDMLSLWQAGVKNTMVIFGLDVSVAQLNALIKTDPDKMIISLNNDEDKNSAGNVAAEKLKRKLLKYFDKNQVAIHLPTANDFGEMSSEQIKEWELRNAV
jgi:DNA primase